MEKITIEQLKYLIAEMERVQAEHPKANVYYDAEKFEIRITYPLPRDFLKIKSFSESLGKANEL